MDELVTVIMTTYNSIGVIRRTLDSVISQDYPRIEIVAADGGSGDGTVKVLSEYEEKLKADPHCSLKWISERDNGIYDAMNKALKMASGQIIGICNDLFTQNDALSKLVSAMRAEGCLGVHSDLVYSDDGRCVRYWHMGEGEYSPPEKSRNTDGYRSVYKGWMPAHPTLYLDRQVYEIYGRYDISYRSSADYEFMLRILAPGARYRQMLQSSSGTGIREVPAVKLAYVPEVLISMYYGGTSNGGLRGYFRNAAEACRALEKNGIRRAPLVIFLRILQTVKQYIDAKRINETVQAGK